MISKQKSSKSEFTTYRSKLGFTLSFSADVFTCLANTCYDLPHTKHSAKEINVMYLELQRFLISWYANQLSVIVKDTPDTQIRRRKHLLWLTVLKVSAYGNHLALFVWQGSTPWWYYAVENNHSPQGQEAKENLLQGFVNNELKASYHTLPLKVST